MSRLNLEKRLFGPFLDHNRNLRVHGQYLKRGLWRLQPYECNPLGKSKNGKKYGNGMAIGSQSLYG